MRPDEDGRSAPRLFHLGGVVLDLVYRIDDLPEPGGARVASAFTACPGGAYHTLAAARAQGMRACGAGGHGTGPFGDLCRAALERLDVPLLLAPLPDLDTGTCVVLTTGNGECTFVGRPGAEGVLSHEQLKALRPSSEDTVVLSGFTASHPGCREAIERWLPTLDERTTLVFDPSPLVDAIPSALLKAVLARTDWPSANASEAEVITGLGTADEQLVALLDGHCPRGRGAIVRAGADGCRLLVRGERTRHLPGHAVRAVDTSGAGDVHVGTFVARLAAGDSPERAATVANAAAALAVMRPSGAAVPGSDEVRRLMSAAVGAGGA